MPKKIDGGTVAKNLNRLVGYTVMGVKADDVSFRIDFMGPKRGRSIGHSSKRIWTNC